MNIIIEEVVSEFPIEILEEIVQINISDAVSYFDIVEVADTSFEGKDGYVPVVDEATGKLVLSPQQAGSGGGVPEAPNNSNAYVRSGLAWVIGYTKTAIDNLLGNKVDKVTGSSLVTDAEKTAITHSNRSILDAITESFTTALKTTYDDASAWVTDIGLQLKTDFDALIFTGSRLITTNEITKCSFITITQAVNLDDIETRVNELDAAVVLKGTWSAASGSFPSGAQAGWSYLVTTNGTIDSVEFASGDRLICVLDNASTTTYAGNWYKADYTDRVNTVAGRTGNVLITSSDLSDFNSAVNALITSALATFKTANFLDFTSSGQTQINAKADKTDLDPLVKHRYFDDLQGYGTGGVGSIFNSLGTLEFEGNILLNKIGTNAVWTRTTAESGRNGIIRGGTGSTSTGLNLIQFRSIWTGTEDFESETSVRIQTLSDATNRFTLIFANGVGTTNSIRFFYSDNVNSGKWQCEAYSGSVSTLVDSGVSVAINTWYVLKVVRISMICYFYINGTLVATISTNIPSNFESFCTMGITKTAGTTSRTCDFDYLKYFDL